MLRCHVQTGQEAAVQVLLYFRASALDIVGGWGLEKELDDDIGEILSAGDTPGLGGGCLFLSIFLLMPKRLMETFGMALFS